MFIYISGRYLDNSRRGERERRIREAVNESHVIVAGEVL
jgi:hypothetical protein